ncbi:hypothetical protein F5Y17DRAFT_258657 [Xylariaceae sp. FL0594]|nr:hypothetical protein F5Y17DRAFT_258657 [Xylariaceae sp. FL0594]
MASFAAVLNPAKAAITCGECHQRFADTAALFAHVEAKGHMAAVTCLQCRCFFVSAERREYHLAVDEPHCQTSPSPSASPSRQATLTPPTEHEYGDCEIDSAPRHFSLHLWRKGKTPEQALLERPREISSQYDWVSPALNHSQVQDLLEVYCPPEWALTRSKWPSKLLVLENEQPFPDDQRTFCPRGFDNTDIPLPLPAPEPEQKGKGRTKKKVYKALVIDCEMVCLHDHQHDLVSITVLDFFTGKPVLNALVQPVGKVRSWLTQFSGVTGHLLNKAKQAQHQHRKDVRNDVIPKNTRPPCPVILGGWPEVRSEIFSMADSSTVLIGHALHEDLKILRIKAPKFIDTQLSLRMAVMRYGRRFPQQIGLARACGQILGVIVQNSGDGHLALEDTLATRELLIWMMGREKELKRWAYNW